MPPLWRSERCAGLIIGLSLLAGACTSSGTSFGYWSDRSLKPVRHELNTGRAALSRGDFETAGPLLESAAGLGHPAALIVYARYQVAAPDGDRAQARALLEEAYAKWSSKRADAAVDLATLLLSEQSSDADLARAVELLEYARAAGHRWTARKLAIALEQQPGHDPDRIDGLWREAARNGDASAKLRLAEQRMAQHGRDAATAGLVSEAVAIFTDQAEAGNVGAMRVLARLYLADRLMPADRAQAAHWLERAVAAKDAAAISDYGRLLHLQGDVGGARRRYEQAAALGAKSAESRLARLALQGQLPDLDPAKIGALAERAIAHDSALVGIYGQALLAGELVPADPARGRSMLERAAADNDVHALYALAMADFVAESAPADTARALENLERAVALDYVTAKVQLGKRLLYGIGVPADPNRGVTLLQAAAAQGHSYAAATLGRAYLLGEGVGEDRAQGRALLSRAAQAGEADAARLLAELGAVQPADAAAAHSRSKSVRGER